MASGGGGHPSHLPLTMPSTSGGSLQTPNTSDLFMSPLGGPNRGGTGNGNFAPSPIGQAQSFSSLEELLNVTGINSMELDASKKQGDGDGVNSLQQMAKEVEKSQGMGRMEPPSKRPRLDTDPVPQLANLSSSSSPASIPPNIRVQPLSSSSSFPPFNSLSQTQNLTTPIASLLDKRSLGNHLDVKPPPTSLPSSHKLFLSDTGGAATLKPSRPPPPPYGFNSTSSESVLPLSSANVSQSVSQLNAFPVSQSLEPPKPPQAPVLPLQSLAQALPSSALPQLSSSQASLLLAQSSALTQVVSSKSQPSTIGGHTTATKLADSINSNSRSVVLQLMQLYKQYQSLNDRQGMGRVRDQLNFLVSAQQKILAAQNKATGVPVSGAPGSQSAQQLSSGATGSQSVQQLGSTGGQQLGGPSKPLSLPASVPATESSGDSSGVQQQQQRATQILGQISAAMKQAPLPTRSSTVNVAASQTSSSSSLPTSVPPVSLNTSVVTTTSTTSSSSWQSVAPKLPPPSYSHSSVAMSGAGTRPSGGSSNLQAGVTPPSALSQGGPSGTAGASNAAQVASTQKAVKQIQMLMAALPEAKRPKNVQELKDFVQRYSSFFNKGLNLNPPAPSTVTGTTTSSSLKPPVSTTSNPPSFPPSSTASRLQQSSGSVQIQSSVTDANAHVNQHFAESLFTFGSSREGSAGPSFGQTSTQSGDSSESAELSKSQQLGVVHAPVTSQFNTASTATSQSKQTQAASVPPSSTVQSTPSSSGGGIQPGIATPLPPGLTLETLGVLCRLPEVDLLKLKLPAALMSAIKVWKARQAPTSTKTKVTNKNNIPVLIPPAPVPSHTSLGAGGSGSLTSSSMVTLTRSTSTAQPHPLPHTLHSVTVKSVGPQPNVLPSGAGFPPRSLHAYIPGAVVNPGMGLGSSHQASPQHMTRYKMKMEQQKIKNEKIQALHKALQSSEEARIAYRFSGHLEKMHAQLSNPDTINAFRSQHDVLARLLPYHLYAEPEPPPAAVEKADAVFESVAQVLLSRSRGLKSRFQQIMTKSDAEGGPEILDMKMQLERLFMEGEQERIQQENLEKKEAEQIAANLSLMADQVDSFDSDFSFGDVFNPLLPVDSGIT